MEHGIKLLYDQNRKQKPLKKRPSQATLENWLYNGMCRAVDGCHVEPDGTCEHGSPSWLIELGLI